jgi:hypothetical protein
MNIHRAAVLPTPKTVCVRVACSSHRVQDFTVSRSVSHPRSATLHGAVASGVAAG